MKEVICTNNGTRSVYKELLCTNNGTRSVYERSDMYK